MTLMHRALTKAYRRRVTGEPAAPPARDEGVTRGWLPVLRTPPGKEPVAPIAADTATTEKNPAAPAVPETSITAETSSGQKLRVDIPAREGAAPAVKSHSVDRQTAEETTDEKSHGLKIRATNAARTTISWRWPDICSGLEKSSAGPQLRHLADTLRRWSVERGLKSIALTGHGRGAGRTSILLTLARFLVGYETARVSLVDLDWKHPALAADLGMVPETGLWEFACGTGDPAGMPIQLLPDRLSAWPLLRAVSHGELSLSRLKRLREALRACREENDVVLVDVGAWEAIHPPLLFGPPLVDGLIGVCRHAAHETEMLTEEHFRHSGVEWLGVIETFVPEEVRPAAAHHRSHRGSV